MAKPKSPKKPKPKPEAPKKPRGKKVPHLAPDCNPLNPALL